MEGHGFAIPALYVYYVMINQKPHFSAGMVYETFISLYYLSYVVSLLFISINYLLVGNTLWQTIHAIESNKFGKPHTLVEAFKQSNINTWTVFFLTFALDGFLSIFNNKIHDMCELRVQRNDSRFRCGYGYHTAVWYPFKEDYVVLEWLLKLWFSLGEILLISLYISTLITTTGILKFLPIRMQDLRHKLQCITESNIQENITQFEYFARYYIYIVRWVYFASVGPSKSYINMFCQTIFLLIWNIWPSNYTAMLSVYIMVELIISFTKYTKTANIFLRSNWDFCMKIEIPFFINENKIGRFLKGVDMNFFIRLWKCSGWHNLTETKSTSNTAM